MIVTSGSDLIAPGTVLPRKDAFCQRLLEGSAPPGSGHRSQPDSGSGEGWRMGSVLAQLLAWELRREELATALGRARVEVAGAEPG